MPVSLPPVALRPTRGWAGHPGVVATGVGTREKLVRCVDLCAVEGGADDVPATIGEEAAVGLGRKRELPDAEAEQGEEHAAEDDQHDNQSQRAQGDREETAQLRSQTHVCGTQVRRPGLDAGEQPLAPRRGGSLWKGFHEQTPSQVYA